LSIAVEQNAITRVKEVPELKDIYAIVSPCPPSRDNGYCFWTIFTGPGLL